jgi:REP element-mobilizing transposase RayT
MESDSPHSRTLRKGRISLAGQTYLVTSTTHNRRPVFADFRLGRVLVNVMRDHAEKGHVESLAFVIMPDHFHWLFTLTGEYPLSKLMGQVKGAAAYQIGQISSSPCGSGFSRESASRDNRIWQKGFYDRALRRDEDIRVVARYTIMNPVRARIVSRIWDYPLWDAVWVDSSSFNPS